MRDHKNERAFLAEMLEKMILEDPDLPESAKLPVHIISTAKRFSEKLHDFVSDISLDIRPGCDEELLKKGREFLEYLQLVDTGFDQYVAIYKEST